MTIFVHRLMLFVVELCNRAPNWGALVFYRLNAKHTRDRKTVYFIIFLFVCLFVSVTHVCSCLLLRAPLGKSFEVVDCGDG